MIVKELYRDSLIYEESSLAHYLYHLLAEKKISLEDDVSKVDFDQANHQVVAEMIRNNLLGFHKIRIYSLKRNQYEFIFIFTASEQEAIQFFCATYHQTPLNCHEYPLDWEICKGKDGISFRDMRKEFTSFPAIAGCFKKEGWPCEKQWQ
ncbi:hypothetical protein BABA_13497 [Neobacillus bataviensis LMG 21833]|uniref:Uncharacterized protein n=1 Tax=Neobacillus bataviensis LMG 21833 TaxID=1117379 RepID=K6E159_9BACI|nr:hypothetical protein [Neobacillus bataviensis]EKN66906.1 hypothetical protein BABA_13497 [Neobacillus bataviensis LMG 21833]